MKNTFMNIHFIRDANKYLSDNKKKGLATVELMILVFVGIVLAAIFFSCVVNITNTTAEGAQEAAKNLFK